jgi:glyoxylase-like metal-dependent hydrolase (beta-lactamase superfamily II)
MDVEREVDRLIDERPGPELLVPAYDDPAYPIEGFIHRSGGTTASYLLATREGRVIVNTGMGFEAPHHRRVFDAVCAGPTPYVVTTQGHVDHVGGVALFREPGTRYVAQAANAACQADDARIARFRAATALLWFGGLADRVREFATRYPGVAVGQDRPTPDIAFEHRLALRVGDLDLELLAAPGGETVDSCVVWLPRHAIALVSNLFGPLFPHFPNFNTLRGDRYRALIDAALGRLHDAVDFVHRETLARINAGLDVFTIMREVELPARLRVGQGYGRVSWAVRRSARRPACSSTRTGRSSPAAATGTSGRAAGCATRSSAGAPSPGADPSGRSALKGGMAFSAADPRSLARLAARLP